MNIFYVIVESFVVRPESSDEHRKLGSRGNMCLLHISQCGVILALQVNMTWSDPGVTVNIVIVQCHNDYR